jgi:hypothetical protein
MTMNKETEGLHITVVEGNLSPMFIKAVIATLRDTELEIEADCVDLSAFRLGWTWPDAYTGIEFQWTEGNYSCDCNRSLFLQRADVGYTRKLECAAGNLIELVRLRVLLADESTTEIVP